MILEYEYLIGFYCKYKDTFEQTKSINITKNKIVINDMSIFDKKIDRKYVVYIDIKKDTLYIRYKDNKMQTLYSKFLVDKIKAYYLYNRRKVVIESI